MDITVIINEDEITKAARRHLALMGKRQTDKHGSLLFAGVTLSENEKVVLDHYIMAAAQVFAGELAPLVTAYDAADNPNMTIENTRWGEGQCAAFSANFNGYAVSYILNAVLGMDYPDLAKKYEQDMANHLNAARNLVFVKQPPSGAEKRYKDMSGEVIKEVVI